MTSKQTSTPFPAVEKMKSWLWIALWTTLGAAVGTVLAYVLFGLVWTNWDAITGQIAAPKPGRSGDPIDNWAKGAVAMMFAFPVGPSGLVAGAFAGFRFGHRRHLRHAINRTFT